MPEVAPPPPTETVTVRSSGNVTLLSANAAVTVTVVAPASSPTEDGFTDRFTTVSSSVNVTVVPRVTKFLLTLSTDSEIVSLLSRTLSSMGVRVNVSVPLVWPAVSVIPRTFESTV